ncbi:MAG: hypothetical protein AAF485_17500, partial [Chloroflexota bacterium]
SILVFLLGTSIFSLYNWYNDPRFSKDDFQALAQFVRERIAEDETVVLSSGHLFPVWAYYYGFDNWTPLPWMQRLDVNQITDLTISDNLFEAVQGKEGVWLVTWQDEVIDPNGVVPFWLDLIGERPNDAGDFWGIGLEHWRLEPEKIKRLQENPIKRPANAETGLAVNFANRVELLGMTQLNNNELVLFWRPRQPLPDNLVFTLDLTDQEGFDWDRETLTGRPDSYLYPPSRWPVGEVVMTRHQLPWQIGSPPGIYIVEIGLGQGGDQETTSDYQGWDILDHEGRPQRRTALLEFANLSHLVEPPNGPLPLVTDPVADLLPIIALRRSILPEDVGEPGDRILLALLWQAGEYNYDNVSVAFDLVDAEDNRFRVGTSFTPSRQFNLPRWQENDTVLGQYWLDIPPDAAPGAATIDLHIINIGAYSYDEVYPIDTLEILPSERHFTPPDRLDMPVNANFAEQAILIGVDCQAIQPDCQAAPGETVTLTLHWQAVAPFDKSYTIFTHLLADDETVLSNADHAPPKPTQGWVPNEIITDIVTMTLPPDIAPGEYPIEIGLYDAEDPAFERVPLTNGETRIILDQRLKIE